MQGWLLTLPYPPKTRSYLSLNLHYIKDGVSAYRDVPYWNEIALILAQFEGYNQTGILQGEVRGLDEFDLWFSQDDIGEIVGGDRRPFSIRPPHKKPKYGRGDHCSGLVRLLPDFCDLFFAHDS
jgi:hypothetical protein